MEVSKSPISLLVKSFIKKNKIFAISLCIISISMVLLISYAGMVYQNIYSRYKTAKQLYGEYQFEIQKLTNQEANQIKKDSLIDKSAIYSRDVYEMENDDICFVISAEKNYCTLSDVKITDGTFPEKENEILCTREYIYKNGIAESEYRGKTITIDEKVYTITGLIEISSSFDTDYSNLFVTKLDDKAEIQSILVDTGSISYKWKLNRLIKKYNIGQYKENQACSKYGSVNGYGIPTGISFFLTIILLGIFVLSVFISAILIRFYHDYILGNIVIYKKIGISSRLIDKSLFYTICYMLGAAMMISNILAMIILSVLWKYSLVLLFVQLIITSFFILVNLLIYIRINKKSKKPIHKVYKKISIDSYINDGKNIYAFLSDSNTNLGKRKQILLGCMIVASSVVCISSIHFMNYIKKFNAVPSGYDYMMQEDRNVGYQVLDKSGDRANTTVEQLNIQVYETLKNLEDMEAVPLYINNNEFEIDKSNIRGKYKKHLLKSDSDFKKSYDYSDKTKVRMILIGLEEDYCEKFGVSKEQLGNLQLGDAIVVRHVRNENGEGFDCQISAGTEIDSVFHYQDNELTMESYTINIVDEIEKMKFVLFDDYSYNTPILFVNLDTFYKIYGVKSPRNIYLSMQGASEERIYETTHHRLGYSIINIKKWDESAKEMVRYYETTVTMVQILMIILIISNLFIFTYINYLQTKNQIMMLKIIGISKNKASYLFEYQIVKIFLRCLIASVILSVIFEYFVWDYITKSFARIEFSLPWETMLIVLGSMSAALIVLIALIHNIIKHENIAASLKKWERL